MSPRKQMAMGSAMKTSTNNDNQFSMNTGGSSFGVSPVLGGVPSLGHMDRNNSGTHLRDHERGARHPIENGGKQLANQANPDHGPHNSTGLHPGGSMGKRAPSISPKAWGSSF
jgi:hypothetical protein